MTPEARQVLLDMKAGLSAGWVQSDLGIDGLGDVSEGVCLLGAAIKVGGGRGDAHCQDAGPGRVWRTIDGTVREGMARYSWWVAAGTPTREAIEALADALGLPAGDWAAIAAWNDEPGRTQQDVVDVIDRVLAKTSPEQQAPARAREETYA